MISKKYYDELKTIKQVTSDPLVIDWFNYIHNEETYGWRTKQMTRKIAELLASRKPVMFFALFCPSYKKGDGKFGFRTDGIGSTTTTGLETLKRVSDHTSTTFQVEQPRAIFFDIAVEQPDKAKPSDLQKNIENFTKNIPEGVSFDLLTDALPEMKIISGWHGFKNNKLPIAENVYQRIVERGKKFYTLFGWTDEMVKDRTDTIVSVEYLVGKLLTQRYPNGIMVYTPTMLERAYIYSQDEKDIPIIFMRH